MTAFAAFVDVEPDRLAGLPGLAHLVRDGRFAIASSSPAVRDGELICLVDGVIDDAPPAGPVDPVEVMLAGWRTQGERLLGSVDGEFATLMWDGRRLVAANDRFGTRGLFWARAGGGTYLASEIDILLRILPASPGLDPSSVAQWLSRWPIDHGRTLFEGVRRIGPASLLRCGDGAVQEHRYWRPVYREPTTTEPGEAADKIRDAIATAVRRRVPAETRAALLLSGGIDSTAIAALAEPARVRGYTASFPAWPAVDETELIDDVVSALGLHGTRLEVGPGGGLIAGGLRHIERWRVPSSAWSDFWEQPLTRTAADDGCQVLLTGDGGDEVFGLYGRSHLVADRLAAGRPRSAARLLRRVPGVAFNPSRRALAHWWWDSGLLPALVPRLGGRAGGTVMQPAGTLRADIRRSMPPRPAMLPTDQEGPRWWSTLMTHVTEGYEAIGLFDHHRRRAGGAGLEARHVLLAPNVVEQAFDIAPELFFHDQLTRVPLRAAVKGRLPDTVRLRPTKSIFNDMVINHVQADLPAVQRVLEAPDLELGAVVDRGAVSELLRGGPQAHPVHPFVWAVEVLRLVFAECWLRDLARPGVATGLIGQGGFAEPALPTQSLEAAGLF